MKRTLLTILKSWILTNWKKTPEKTKLRELLSKVKKIVTFFRQSERATTELLLLQKDLPEVKRLR